LDDPTTARPTRQVRLRFRDLSEFSPGDFSLFGITDIRAERRAGEVMTATIRISKDDLKFHDPDAKQWVLDRSYTLYAGNSSRDAMKRRIRLAL
jgi:hypothetical protein